MVHRIQLTQFLGVFRLAHQVDGVPNLLILHHVSGKGQPRRTYASSSSKTHASVAAGWTVQGVRSLVGEAAVEGTTTAARAQTEQTTCGQSRPAVWKETQTREAPCRPAAYQSIPKLDARHRPVGFQRASTLGDPCRPVACQSSSSKPGGQTRLGVCQDSSLMHEDRRP